MNPMLSRSRASKPVISRLIILDLVVTPGVAIWVTSLILCAGRRQSVIRSGCSGQKRGGNCAEWLCRNGTLSFELATYLSAFITYLLAAVGSTVTSAMVSANY